LGAPMMDRLKAGEAYWGLITRTLESRISPRGGNLQQVPILHHVSAAFNANEQAVQGMSLHYHSGECIDTQSCPYGLVTEAF